MPPTASDKALNALVAELAATTPEDMAAVLAMLDPRQVARLRPLIAAHIEGEPDDRKAAPARLDTSGVSDWLAERMRGKDGDDGEWRMTPTTIAALRTLAASMPRQAKSLPSARPASQGEGLGLFRRFSGRGPNA